MHISEEFLIFDGEILQGILLHFERIWWFWMDQERYLFCPSPFPITHVHTISHTPPTPYPQIPPGLKKDNSRFSNMLIPNSITVMVFSWAISPLSDFKLRNFGSKSSSMRGLLLTPRTSLIRAVASLARAVNPLPPIWSLDLNGS